MENVPLRYGVNILEAGWGRRHDPNHLAYQAELIDCGDSGKGPLTFFAYEWINPRRGIRVKEIRLKASTGFRNVDGHAAPENPLLLAARERGKETHTARTETAERCHQMITKPSLDYAKMEVKENQVMTGIQFVTDHKGRKTAVLIDLKKHRELWEDFWDGLVSESRRKEKPTRSTVLTV